VCSCILFEALLYYKSSLFYINGQSQSSCRIKRRGKLSCRGDSRAKEDDYRTELIVCEPVQARKYQDGDCQRDPDSDG
jgi:hypothetical protein